MSNSSYRLHRIVGDATHRVHSIQCLNNEGVAVGLCAAMDGTDYGIAICESTTAGSWSAMRLHELAEPTIRDINDAGQFVGWTLRRGREHAIVGNTQIDANISIEIWPSHSGATAIDAVGAFVGFRRRGGQLCGFVQEGTNVTDLERPSSSDHSLSFHACSLSSDGIVVGAFLGSSGEVLTWRRTGELLDRISVEFGGPIRRSENGFILCDHGVVADGEHIWFPYARGCSDFVARAINSTGQVVGFGRALDP